MFPPYGFGEHGIDARERAFEVVEASRFIRADLERRAAVARWIPRTSLRVAFSGAARDSVRIADPADVRDPFAATETVRAGLTVELRLTWGLEPPVFLFGDLRGAALQSSSGERR